MSCRDEKVKKLRENTPTILSPNCWAGITYHHLGLQFRSPLINMWEDHDEYIRLLSDLKGYMSKDLVFKEMYFDKSLKAPFPVGMLGDVTLYMNHYKDFESAKEAFDRRKKRINWDYIIVMLYDESPERARRFLDLPFEHKICFVPYRSDDPRVISIPYREQEKLQRYPFWEIVNNLALGDFELYDDVDLIYGGKYTKIGDILRR